MPDPAREQLSRNRQRTVRLASRRDNNLYLPGLSRFLSRLLAKLNQLPRWVNTASRCHHGICLLVGSLVGSELHSFCQSPTFDLRLLLMYRFYYIYIYISKIITELLLLAIYNTRVENTKQSFLRRNNNKSRDTFRQNN